MHEHATGRIPLHRSDETMVKRGALAARHLSRLKEWHNDCNDLFVVHYQSANILFE